MCSWRGFFWNLNIGRKRLNVATQATEIMVQNLLHGVVSKYTLYIYIIRSLCSYGQWYSHLIKNQSYMQSKGTSYCSLPLQCSIPPPSKYCYLHHWSHLFQNCSIFQKKLFLCGTWYNSNKHKNNVKKLKNILKLFVIFSILSLSF